jgi:propionate CoA-transferase
MDFRPVIPRDPIAMDPRIFREGAMDLREDMLSIPLDQRFTLDEQQNLFFVNLERFALRSRADIGAIARAVEARRPQSASLRDRQLRQFLDRARTA